jgi:hypothetical protein
MKKLWQWLDGKKRNIACLWWGLFAPTYALVVANGIHIQPWVAVMIGAIGLLFTYVGLGHAAMKAQLDTKVLGNNSGEVDKGLVKGAAGGVVAAGLLAGLGVSQGVIEINDGSHIALSKSTFISAAALPAEALVSGAMKTDSVDGVPITIACDRTIENSDGGLSRQISKPEFRSGHEFEPGHMVVMRIFDADADGNEALVGVNEYLLSERTDGWIYTVAAYPVITPNPKSK